MPALPGLHTFLFLAPAVDTSACHEDIVDYGEAALATDPLAILRHDSRIVEDGGLVKKHTPAMHGARERHLIWVEVVEA